MTASGAEAETHGLAFLTPTTALQNLVMENQRACERAAEHFRLLGQGPLLVAFGANRPS